MCSREEAYSIYQAENREEENGDHRTVESLLHEGDIAEAFEGWSSIGGDLVVCKL